MSYHPIKDWLEELPPWDGEPRCCWLFEYYFGGNPNAIVPSTYEAGIGVMFMIGMVARIYKPGCQLDHMPVIEGPQGQRKSTACRVLAGDAYFGDNLPDISNKDSSQYLRGKWLVEISEMHVFDRADTARLKSFISRQTEKYFARYGRSESVEPRQCCFIGTTNDDEYLKDSTGGRRFWPIRSGEVNIERLIQDRDQLFAEALHRFRAGEQWWPTPEFEREHIKPEQDARLESDLWDDAAERWLATRTIVTAKELVEHLINLELMDRNKQGKAEKGRVRDILRKFKFVPKRDMEKRWWEKLGSKQKSSK